MGVFGGELAAYGEAWRWGLVSVALQDLPLAGEAAFDCHSPRGTQPPLGGIRVSADEPPVNLGSCKQTDSVCRRSWMRAT